MAQTKTGPTPVVSTIYLGTWVGSSTVSLASGLPECRPSPWSPGGSEHLRVEIGSGGSAAHYRMRIIEPVSGTSCELFGSEEARTLEAWGGIEDVFLPEHDFCHRLVESASWPCQGTRPHVWQTDTSLKISLLEGTDNEARGQLSIGYDHSFGDAWFGPWTFGRILKTVTLVRQPD